MNMKRMNVVGWLVVLVVTMGQASLTDELQTDKLSAMQQEAIDSYRAGQYDRATKRYGELIALQPGNVELLKDLMWVSWHAKRFEDVMNVAEQIRAYHADDSEVWKLVGKAQMALGRNEEAIQAFKRSLLFDPEQLSLWRLIAQLLLDLRQYAAATQLLTQLHQRAPEEATLYPLLARAQTVQGHFAEAAQAWATARAAFPEELAYAYQEAAALYRSGQPEQALAAVEALVGRQSDYGPAMEFLVAHAIVNRDWTAAAGLLERQLARPIPGDEPRLLKLAGVYSHSGNTRLYLKTLDRCLRLNPSEEWTARIAADYRLGQETIARQVGKAPVAFAYPESNFGQQGAPNTAGAVPVNLGLARRMFGTAYHQDLYGLNVRSEDPMLLARLEPSAAWTGAELIRHVTHSTPFVRVHLALLRQATWEGRFHAALRWLDALRPLDSGPDLLVPSEVEGGRGPFARDVAPAESRGRPERAKRVEGRRQWSPGLARGAPQDGVSPSLVLIEEGRLRFASGDPITGHKLVAQALTMDRAPETAQLARAVQQGKAGWVWTPSVSFQQDNRDREHLIAHQRLESWRMGPAIWRVHHRAGLFREANIDDVMDHGLGLGATVPLGLFHQVNVDAMGHLFAGEAGETMTASGGVRSRWFDGLTTSLEAGQALVETARALHAGVKDRYVSVRTAWDAEGPWRASAQAKAADLSDDNRRYTSIVELSRSVGLLPSLRMIYRFTADDTQAVSPHYYSPQRLFLHQVGAEYHLPLFRKGSSLSLRYLPGYGQEEGSNARLIHTLEIAAPMNQQGKVRLRPSLFITRTPTFQNQMYGLTLQVLF